MKNKQWKETKPLPCEVCACCKYEARFSSYFDKLICNKYQVSIYVPAFSDRYIGVNGKMYERLQNARCTKNYPSLWKKICFRWRCWLKYLDDRRYHRLED